MAETAILTNSDVLHINLLGKCSLRLVSQTVRGKIKTDRIKTIPMEKKCKKAEWLSGEALQIAVKRREAKSKGEKEGYKHLNAEFQRITRRDKKSLLQRSMQRNRGKQQNGKD